MPTRRRGTKQSPPRGADWEQQEEGQAAPRGTSGNGRHHGPSHVGASVCNLCYIASIRCRRMMAVNERLASVLRMNRGNTSRSGTPAPVIQLQHYTRNRTAAQDLGIVFTVSLATTATVAALLFHHAALIQQSSLSILVKRYDFASVNDIGGWIAKPYAFPRLSTLKPMKDVKLQDEYRRDVPDYGGLHYVAVSADSFFRVIDPNDNANVKAEMEKRKKMKSRRVAREWAFDDDEVFNPKCRRPDFWGGYRPTCNNLHSYDLAQKYDEDILGAENHEFDSAYINHGFFREVWLLEDNGFAGPDEMLALKMLRYKHNFDYQDLENVRRDALIMEVLSASPRIVDIYGHCSFSITVEAIENEMEDVIVPGSGYAQAADINDSKDVDPKNNYSAVEKLDIALAMAESIADLHGFKEGVIVHDDIQLCQWLKTKDGNIKLGDFNRAEIMLWDEVHGRYCKYNNGKGYGNYRAPEEFAAKDIDEAIDVYSMGNNIYGLLTGLWVFYENEDDGVVQTKIIGGDLPYVDERYRTRSYIEGRLVEIMERCWIYKPEDRVDIFQVMEFLRDTKAEYERRVAAGAGEALESS